MYRAPKSVSELTDQGQARVNAHQICTFICFQILQPTMNKWAQYPAKTGAYIELYAVA